MTDAEYIFKKTNAERKRIGTGAYHKKSGSKTKYCSLQSDKLTKKQLKELNGEMTTYNLNKKMEWHDFKLMPKDIQREYITTLIVTHEGRGKDIASMFGIGNSTFSKYISDNFPSDGFFKSTGRRNLSDEWLKFISGEALTGSGELIPVEAAKEQPEPTERVKQARISLSIESGELNCSGNAAAIFQKVLMAMDLSKEYNVCIKFEEKKPAEGV